MKKICIGVIILSVLMIICEIMNIYVRDCLISGSDYVCDNCIGALRLICSDNNITYAQINILLFIILEPLIMGLNMIMLLITLLSNKFKKIILFLLTLESVVGCLLVLFLSLYYFFYKISVYG